MELNSQKINEEKNRNDLYKKIENEVSDEIFVKEKNKKDLEDLILKNEQDINN